jgi:hypothetical protein
MPRIALAKMVLEGVGVNSQKGYEGGLELRRRRQMTIIRTAPTISEMNQIARSSLAGTVPLGTDSTILAIIRVAQEKSAITRIFSRMNLSQFMSQRVYHTLL